MLKTTIVFPPLTCKRIGKIFTMERVNTLQIRISVTNQNIVLEVKLKLKPALFIHLTFPLFLFQKFVLDKLVKGANVAMLIASTCSAFIVLIIAYMGCRSLPRCSCYDGVTGMVCKC